MTQVLVSRRTTTGLVGVMQMGTGRATRTVVSVFGLLVALTGIEHGVGEILQGSVHPDGLVIESWPHAEAMEILQGEPAMTIVPNLLISGLLTVAVAIAVGIWSFAFIRRRHAGAVLLLLSGSLLLVGGGFGPPLVGIVIGTAATRIGVASARASGTRSRAVGRIWPWSVGAGVLGYLGLFPGTVLLDAIVGVESAGLVWGLTALSFGGLLLSVVAARAYDHGTTADRASGG